MTVWAESKSDGVWSFGSSSYTGDENYGYPMPVSGRVLSLCLRSINPTSDFNINKTYIVVNGEKTPYYVYGSSANTRCTWASFDIPLEVAKGDVLNFDTENREGTAEAQIISLLIELDL